jgi:hypothetical protein
MVNHILPNFLQGSQEYEKAAAYWVDLWNRVGEYHRQSWRHPWMSSGIVAGEELRDGNPIFSVYSPENRYGIRVIQYPPESDRLEFDWWLDTFGGPRTDPKAIRELVIACALSEEAARRAFELMEEWCVRGEITERYDQPFVLDHGYVVIPSAVLAMAS